MDWMRANREAFSAKGKGRGPRYSFSMIPAYKTVSMRDIVFQAKAKTSNPGMNNDMVCHCAEGELRIKQGPGMEFVAKKGDVWSCNKGLPEDTENIGSGVSIMRVIDFDLA